MTGRLTLKHGYKKFLIVKAKSILMLKVTLTYCKSTRIKKILETLFSTKNNTELATFLDIGLNSIDSGQGKSSSSVPLLTFDFQMKKLYSGSY